MDEKTLSSHTVERLTVDGVDVPVVELGDSNEEQVSRVFAVLDALDAADAPAFIISTATT